MSFARHRPWNPSVRSVGLSRCYWTILNSSVSLFPLQTSLFSWFDGIPSISVHILSSFLNSRGVCWSELRPLADGPCGFTRSAMAEWGVWGREAGRGDRRRGSPVRLPSQGLPGTSETYLFPLPLSWISHLAFFWTSTEMQRKSPAESFWVSEASLEIFPGRISLPRRWEKCDKGVGTEPCSTWDVTDVPGQGAPALRADII